MPTENNNILSSKCQLRHWKQIINKFIAPLPTSVFSEEKAADRAVFNGDLSNDPNISTIPLEIRNILSPLNFCVKGTQA